jgi:hypothetical protein
MTLTPAPREGTLRRARRPGTRLGPCTEPCEHSDCKALREAAAKVCSLCGGAIGYDRFFYEVGGAPEHAVCENSQTNEEAA